MSTTRNLARLHCFVGALCVGCCDVLNSAVAVAIIPLLVLEA